MIYPSPPPMAETTYNETVKFMLHPRYVVAAQNMKDAAKEVRREILDDYDKNAVCFGLFKGCLHSKKS